MPITNKDVSFFNKNLQLLDEHITNSAKRFELERDVMVKAGLRYPNLFCQNTDTLDSNITEAAKLLEVDKQAYIKNALRMPLLFSLSADRVDKNISEFADLIDVDKKTLISVALKRPQLFTQTGQTMHKNISEAAERLGVDKKEYVQAALKQPQLFYLAPETVAGKAKIYSYYKELIKEPANNLLSCVRLISDKHLLAQVLGVMINSQTDKNMHVVTRTRYKDIVEFLNNNPAEYNLVADYREGTTEKLLKFAKEVEQELKHKISIKIKIR